MKSRRFRLTLLAAVAVLAATGVYGAGKPFSGKSGANLKNAIAATSRPTAITAYPLDFFRAAESDRHVLTDCFSDRIFKLDGSATLPEDVAYVTVMPVEWWRYEESMRHTYGDTVSRDLLNQFIGHKGIMGHKSYYPPAILEKITYDDGGFWQTGLLTVDGIETNGWAPPRDRRGDFARTIFYMATLYPTSVWDPWAGLILGDTSYPSLTPYGIAMLMDWHRRDPVDDSERRRNDAAERFQGNRNLFVDYPELAEYLWGIHAGEIYEPASDDPQTPIALRGQYRLSDPRIDLWSPRIPEDAKWSVDGIAAKSSTLTPRELGPGRHHLSYTVADTGEKGILQIEIVP